jgi:CRISPR-associated protein Cmr5
MTLERKIAAKARGLIERRKGADDSAKRKEEAAYRAACEGLPVLLRSAGLTQAVAFLKVKQKEIYDDIEGQFRELQYLREGESLLQKVTQSSLPMQEYRLLCEVALLIAVWHKRMAQALLRTKKEMQDAQPASH